MKLLLTSAGITNKSIEKALSELLQKEFYEANLVFIPTASNLITGDKNWLIQDLISLKNLNFKSIEITDVSAVPENIWKPSLENADVLFFEGGSTYSLMKWLNKVGISDLLPSLLKDKIYVGVSAGSMITSPDLALKLSQIIYEEEMLETQELKGLNFVDFYFLPHLDSEWFKKVRRENIQKIKKEIDKQIYALDDNSAIKIDDNKLEVISEGEWFQLN